jgi:hypothetical protein
VPSAISSPTALSVVAFLAGSAFGALALFTASIHRDRRVPLFRDRGQRRGAISRSVLVATRTSREEADNDHHRERKPRPRLRA